MDLYPAAGWITGRAPLKTCLKDAKEITNQPTETVAEQWESAAGALESAAVLCRMYRAAHDAEMRARSEARPRALTRRVLSGVA